MDPSSGRPHPQPKNNRFGKAPTPGQCTTPAYPVAPRFAARFIRAGIALEHRIFRPTQPGPEQEREGSSCPGPSHPRGEVCPFDTHRRGGVVDGVRAAPNQAPPCPAGRHPGPRSPLTLSPFSPHIHPLDREKTLCEYDLHAAYPGPVDCRVLAPHESLTGHHGQSCPPQTSRSCSRHGGKRTSSLAVRPRMVSRKLLPRNPWTHDSLKIRYRPPPFLAVRSPSTVVLPYNRAA
jgi:hypothetical protein